MNSGRGRRSARGFTLMEVVVALAILGVAVSVLFRVYENALSQTADDRLRSTAALLAQSLLSQVEATPLTDGDGAGDYGNGFRWQVHVEPYGDADDRAAWQDVAKRVSVWVVWDAGGRQRSVTLTTLVLTQKASVP